MECKNVLDQGLKIVIGFWNSLYLKLFKVFLLLGLGLDLQVNPRHNPWPGVQGRHEPLQNGLRVSVLADEYFKWPGARYP